MRTIIVIALILVCASMAGWFSINREDGETTIRINRDEIRQDARAAIDRGKNYLDRKDGEQFASQQQGQLQPPQNWQGQQQYQQQGGQQQYTQQQYTQQQYGQQQYPPQQQYQQPATQQQQPRLLLSRDAARQSSASALESEPAAANTTSAVLARDYFSTAKNIAALSSIVRLIKGIPQRFVSASSRPTKLPSDLLVLWNVTFRIRRRADC